jgi:hypothetical protein
VAITIQLSPDIETALRAEAEAQGRDPAELVRTLVEEIYAVAVGKSTTGSRPETRGQTQSLAEALEGLTGVIDSRERTGGPSRLSEDEDAFAEALERKREEGRL